MTLDEVRDNVGSGVIFTPAHGDREDGVITGASSRFAFVRYRGDQHAKATDPANLILLAGSRRAAR